MKPTTTEDQAHASDAIDTVKPKKSCCGGPPPAASNACCARDAEAKERGAAGCGCDGQSGTGNSSCC